MRTEIVNLGRPSLRSRLVVLRIRRATRAWAAAYNSGSYPNRPPERIVFDHDRRRVVVEGAPSLRLGRDVYPAR